MKTLIIYASKTGTTKKCAEKINQQIRNSEIVNVSSLDKDPKNYDLIIVGSPIRMGMIDKKIKKFLASNLELLKAKQTAYFICCGFNENWQKYYFENFPKELLSHAIIYDSFGGEIDPAKQKGFDKLIVKMVSRNLNKAQKIAILNDRINKFITILNR